MGHYNYETRFRKDYLIDQLAQQGFDVKKLQEQGIDIDVIFDAANDVKNDVKNDASESVFFSGAEINQIQQALFDKVGESKTYFDIGQALRNITDPE